MVPDRDDLPKDQEILKDLIIQQARLIEKLQCQVENLSRHVYGRRSEKLAPLDEAQGQLFEELAPAAPEAPPADPPATSPPASQRQRRNAGTPRGSIPPSLPRLERHHRLETTSPCTSCGKHLREIGQKDTEMLDYLPASWYAIRDVTYSYACGCGESIVNSDAPQRPIIGGLPGPGALAHVLASKYADHLPLHRQEGILQRHGIEISRSVLCGWVKNSAELLMPIYAALRAALLQLDYIGFDATPVKVQEKGRGRTHRGTFWAYRGGRSHAMVVFEYSRQHNRDGPTSFLKEFRGYVQADAHPVYDPVYKDGRVEVGCWSHARRGFEKIVANSRRRSGLHAEVALAHIQGLFKVEKDAGEAGLDPAERHELRQTRSQPILEKLKPWIDDMLKVTPPRTALGGSLAYLNNHWQALTRFLEDGRLEIHNNLVEQELRSIAVGRKNWTFFGNESGAEWASVHYSLIASCRRAEVDPFLYLRDVLERISVHPASRVEELLPHRWKENFEAEARAAVQASLNELRD